MNQAVIEQDGMSRNTPANPTPDSLTGLLLPLSDRTLLLPNVAVAELIAYRNPQVAAGLPQWYLGQVAWRDLRLPLLSSRRPPAANSSGYSAAARGWWSSTPSADDPM